MVGNLALAGQVLGAGDLVREDRGQQVLGLHALQLRRHLAAADEARQRQRGGGVPAPAHAEQRRVEQRLHQHVERRGRVQVARDFVQREAVAGRQRQHDRVLGRRGLQLEIELAAEALAQRQAPGAVEAAAEGRMDHQLHAAGFVEEALHHDALLRRQRAERAQRARQVVDDLARGFDVEADSRRRASPIAAFDAAARPALRCDLLAQARHAERQLVAAPRRLAQPERDVRRRRRARPPPAPGRARSAGCGSWRCRAGRRRRPGSRPRSPR